jgi:hypothetical protein
VASCSSVIGTSTGGCTWSGAPAALGGRPCRALVSLWPSWRCRATPATSAAPAGRTDAAGRRAALLRWPPGLRRRVIGMLLRHGWSPRPANCRHSPIRLLGENATNCWCATRRPAAPSATRPRAGATTSGGRRKYCAGPCRVFQLWADWEVDGGSACPTSGSLGMRWLSAPQLRRRRSFDEGAGCRVS